MTLRSSLEERSSERLRLGTSKVLKSSRMSSLEDAMMRFVGFWESGDSPKMGGCSQKCLVEAFIVCYERYEEF